MNKPLSFVHTILMSFGFYATSYGIISAYFENNVEYGMKVTLPDFNKANVLAVGDVMLDRYWYEVLQVGSHQKYPVPVVK